MPRPSARLALLLLAAALAACDTRDARLPTVPPDGPSAELAPVTPAGADSIPGRYIVVLDPQVASASATAEAIVTATGGEVHYTYDDALKGFAASLPPAAVEQLRSDPQVAYVVPDGWAYPSSAPWGLDRIDERNRPLNGTYSYGSTGAGVRVYVIDTGIRTSHAQFAGRAGVGADFVGDGRNGQDCNGHGTHVAGTIAGVTYGVAKAAQVVSVRVFGCSGGAPFSTIIAAVNWVTANAVKPAVVNMSLGGSLNAAMNQAVQNSISAGLVYSVAAGNQAQSACNFSPASTPQALTVGASTATDTRAAFSNWGSCVDLFAPGANITSAWFTGNTAVWTLNGTSMAAPHAAGVAALYLQDRPSASPADVIARIVATSSPGKLSDIRSGSPNRLLYSWTPPLAPTGVTGTRLSTTRVLVAWTDAGTRETGYFVQRGRQNANGSWSSFQDVGNVPANRTSLTDAGVEAGGTYRYRVRACNPGGCSSWVVSRSVNLPTPPPAPSGMTVTAASATEARIAWTDAGASETSFVLARGLLGLDGVTWGAYETIATLPANRDTHRDPGLSPGRRYRYRVRACNTAGCSEWSGGRSVLMPSPPLAPTAFTGVAISSTQVRLTWTDASTNETSFVLRRAVRTTSGAWGPMETVTTLPQNTASFVDTVASGQTYLYRITACNTAGCAPSVRTDAISVPSS